MPAANVGSAIAKPSLPDLLADSPFAVAAYVPDPHTDHPSLPVFSVPLAPAKHLHAASLAVPVPYKRSQRQANRVRASAAEHHQRPGSWHWNQACNESPDSADQGCPVHYWKARFAAGKNVQLPHRSGYPAENAKREDPADDAQLFPAKYCCHWAASLPNSTRR